MKPVAVLLAGGTARRMGGGDKPLTLLAGRPILAHVIHRIAPQVAALAINANGDPSRFAAFGYPVIADEIEGNPGPLAGIHAGMNWASTHHPRATTILSVPTDLPFLPADLVARLQRAKLDSDADIAIATTTGQSHPVVALWPIAYAAELQQALTREDMRKVTLFAARHRTVHVDFPTDAIDPFFNINTPDQLRQAQALIE